MAKKRADGLIEKKFTFEGRRYSVYGRTARECNLKADAKKEELRAGMYKRGRCCSMNDYFERWITNKAGTVKETTIRTDTVLLNRISGTRIDAAGRTFGELKLQDVEPQNVRDLQKALQKPVTVTRGDKKKTLQGMKTRSVNDAIHLLKAVFKSAVIDGDLIRNPAEGVKPLKRTEDAARDTIHRALTKAETAAFMEAAEQGQSYYLPLYRFLLNTGCRIGEAGAIFPADVKKGKLHICRTVTRTEIGGYMIGDDTKTAAGRRVVPLNDAALHALEEQKEQYKALYGDKIIGLKEPLFTSPERSLLKSASVNYDIHNYCERAGVQKFSVHAFRDTFATRCVESGMQVKTLQEILGHTDVSMTLGLYAHSMDEAKEEQLKAVSFI